MTIQTAGNRVSFTCNGTTTVFPINLQAYLATDFTVILTNTTTSLSVMWTLNNQFTMAMAGTLQPTYWTLTATTAPLAGYTLQVFVNPSQVQQTNYVQGQAFPSAAVLANMDRLTQMVQRLQDQVNRSVRAPDGDLTPAMMLPNAASRELQYLATDANGNVITTSALPGTSNNASSLGLALNPVTKAESAAGVVPTALQYAAFDARRYGAVGDGVTDDSIAVANAIKVAQEGFYDVRLLSSLVGGAFSLNETIAFNYTGQGQITNKGADITGPAILLPHMATNVFEVDMDAYGQQEMKLLLADFQITGDGINFPTFCYANWMDFSAIRNVSSFNTGPTVNWQNCGQVRVTDCVNFGGATVGFDSFGTRSGYVTQCHAYQKTIGFRATGVNNYGADGGMSYTNCVSHVHSQTGYSFTGQYQLTMTNCVAENNKVHIYQRSCNYGTILGGFLGPANGAPNYSLQFDYIQSGDAGNNAYNIVSAVNMQNETQWSNTQFCIFSNSLICGVPSSVTGAAISFGGSSLNLLTGLMVRANTGCTYSFIQDATSNFNTIDGGRYEGQIYLQGTKATRGGGNIITPSFLSGGIKTDDAVQGQFALNEYVRFWDGTRINETGVGYLLPYLAQTGTLAASGGTATFDTSTIVAVPIGGASNSTEAEFMVSGGATGSISASKILVVRGFELATATILGGNGARGSFTVSVSGSVITVTNPSATANVPYTIRMTKHASY